MRFMIRLGMRARLLRICSRTMSLPKKTLVLMPNRGRRRKGGIIATVMSKFRPIRCCMISLMRGRSSIATTAWVQPVLRITGPRGRALGSQME